jgi:hypothetical protein
MCRVTLPLTLSLLMSYIRRQVKNYPRSFFFNLFTQLYTTSTSFFYIVSFLFDALGPAVHKLAYSLQEDFMELLVKPEILTSYIYMDLRLATLNAASFYLLHVSTMIQCIKLSCGTVVCKHFASYQG